MKSILILCLLTALIQLSLLQQCSQANCQEPNCRCMSTNPPAGLTVEETPQMVILTFDGAVRSVEMPYYTDLLEFGFLNPNGCPISATFFLYHEYNDYNFTNYLYNKYSQTIGTHSLSHTTPISNWSTYDETTWRAEIGGMTYAASAYANIPVDAIKGQKCPFRQCNGDVTFDAMQAKGVLYDNSFSTVQYMDPPIWPYTMDFGLQHDCTAPPCPSQSHPGIWTFPIVSLKDQNGFICATVDCSRPENQQETFQYLLDNFNRHFQSNRAPFIISQTATAWFQSYPYTYLGLIQFLEYINRFDEVYVVSMNQAFEWVKNPLPLATAGLPGESLACPGQTQQPCQAKSCTYGETNGEPVQGGGLRGGGRFVSCSANCPDRFPWTCNPQGIEPRPDVCNEGV